MSSGRRVNGRAKADASGARQEILNASALLFAQNGYRGTSTRAIADQVGMRQASLYYHFANKDEILLELLTLSIRPSLAYVDVLSGHTNPAGALYAFVALDVATLMGTPHNIGTMYFAHDLQQPQFSEFREARGELLAAYVTLCQRAATGSDSEYQGLCCMHLAEMVIQVRTHGEPPCGLASQIAATCLRVIDCYSNANVADGEQLRAALEQLARDP